MKRFSNILFVLVSILLSIFLARFLVSITNQPVLFIPVALLLFAASVVPVKNPRSRLCMALNAQSITFNGGNNMAGTQAKIYWAFISDIDKWPTALNIDFDTATSFDALINVPVADPFVMKAGKSFYELYCTLEEGQVKFSQIGVRDSMAFEQSYENSYPKNDAKYLGFTAVIANTPGIVALVPEANGVVRVIGMPTYPAYQVTSEGDGGKKTADGRKHVLTLKSNACIPPAIYLAPIPLTPAA